MEKVKKMKKIIGKKINKDDCIGCENRFYDELVIRDNIFSGCVIDGKNIDISLLFVDNVIFEDCHLMNLSLFSEGELESTIFTNVSFNNCTFTNINMYNVNLNNSSFFNLTFDKCSFRKVFLERIDFSYSKFYNLRVNNCDFEGFYLSKSNFDFCDFSLTKINTKSFIKSKLQKISLLNTKFLFTNFYYYSFNFCKPFITHDDNYDIYYFKDNEQYKDVLIVNGVYTNSQNYFYDIFLEYTGYEYKGFDHIYGSLTGEELIDKYGLENIVRRIHTFLEMGNEYTTLNEVDYNSKYQHIREIMREIIREENRINRIYDKLKEKI